MKCAYCGANLPEGSTVCFECGAPQDVVNTQAAQPSQAEVKQESREESKLENNFSQSSEPQSQTQENAGGGAKCVNCGAALPAGATVCFECGYAQTTPRTSGASASTKPQQSASASSNAGHSNTVSNVSRNVTNAWDSFKGTQKSRLVAGLLAIFLGSFGVDQFYLCNVKMGVIRLALFAIGSLASFGILGSICTIWGIVEGVRILIGKVNTDANGNPLV